LIEIDPERIQRCAFCLVMDSVCSSSQGFKQQALAVSTDSEHRFELALQLGELKIAYQLAVEAEVNACSLVFKTEADFISLAHLCPI